MEYSVLHSNPLPSCQSDNHWLSYSDLPEYNPEILQAKYIPLCGSSSKLLGSCKSYRDQENFGGKRKNNIKKEKRYKE